MTAFDETCTAETDCILVEIDAEHALTEGVPLGLGGANTETYKLLPNPCCCCNKEISATASRVDHSDALHRIDTIMGTGTQNRIKSEIEKPIHDIRRRVVRAVGLAKSLGR